MEVQILPRYPVESASASSSLIFYVFGLYMPIYNKIPDSITDAPVQRISLDERFLSLLIPEDAHDRLEAQELRQLVHRTLKTLSDDEMRVIELRYQYKKSPGQTASRMGISREQMAEFEQSGLEKLREGLKDWHRGI
jgi:RNA polymerase sigma factor (sigma-70 family)